MSRFSHFQEKGFIMPPTALPPLDQVDPVEAWKPWEPDANQPWDLKWAGHLFRRAGFGAPLPRLQEAVRNGFPATLERLLLGDAAAGKSFDAVRTSMGGGIAGRNNPFELRGWWVYCLIYNPHPLREKMTLFWHNHFATSIVKVQKTELMYQQNERLYRHALGKFPPFLLEMSRDPAMLVWLDSNSNVKGKANENYARELMELFSLGVGHYTEQDVREAARAFTGWHVEGDQFYFSPTLHDDGAKKVLGQAGNWDGGDVVRIVLEQPAAPRFLVRKFYRFLIGEAVPPPDALLQPLADRFQKSGYDVADLVKAMLGSRHFFSAHAYRQRIKSPVEFLLGAVHDVGQGFVRPNALVNRLNDLGQQLFAPPNVKGWDGGRSWLNTATVVARHNFVQTLTAGSGEINLGDPTTGMAVAVDPANLVRRQKLTEPEPILALLTDHLYQGDIPTSARSRLLTFLTDGQPKGDKLDQRIREVTHAMMTMPEYQLA